MTKQPLINFNLNIDPQARYRPEFYPDSQPKHPSMSTTRNITKKRPGTPPSNHGDGGSPSRAAPPPGVDPQIWKSFLSIDTYRSGYITATQLHTALRNGDWPSFEIDTVKCIINIFDTNRNGTIDINEFDGLWKYLKSWEGVFHHFDKDKNNLIDGDELQEALEKFGYNLSPALHNLLKRKYDVPWPSAFEVAAGADPAAASSTDHSAPPGITFDRFMRACIVLKQLKETFEELDKDSLGRVKINFEQLLEVALKLA